MPHEAKQPEPPARLFTVPPGQPFLAALARAVLAGGFPASGVAPPDELALARWTILLPTRRASRALAGAFLDAGGAAARLLPRIRAIGDPDEEELLWPADAEEPDGLDLPPAIPPIRRLFLLSNLIRAWAAEKPRGRLSQALVASPAQVVALARSLAGLIDSCETEQTTLAALDGLLDEELPGHQAAALDFLDILSVKLPELVEGQGFVGPVERRNRLMEEAARRLTLTRAPVIAAGSTGSIPATARLLATIARLEQGAVVLPGLDLDLDEESWAELQPQHPQYGMAELLKRIGVERADVRLLPGVEPGRPSSRGWLASEIMRPSATTHRWHQAFSSRREGVESALAGVETVEAADRREEAAAIALIMRRTLEDESLGCALVTPDRSLARRVKTELRRWGVAVDDSAGEPLIRLPAGAFLGLVSEAAASGLAPGPLTALLDHPHCRLGRDRARVVASARPLEAALFRARRPTPPDSLVEAVVSARAGMDSYTPAPVKRIGERGWRAMAELCETLARILGPLIRLLAADRAPLADLIQAHVEAVDALSSDGGSSSLWRGDEGEALSGLLASLLAEAPRFYPLRPGEYPPLLNAFLASTPVRPTHGPHPRLAILGLLEARMVDSDITILGGLNEGVWPMVAETGPWLNRPQLKRLGLPAPERRIGLSAHDFAQGFCRPRVVLTWSRKIGTAPAVPSRWIMRLKALRGAAGLAGATTEASPWLGWARVLDRPAAVLPASRPRVTPAVALRPRKLSVTRVEELIRDPYAAFARHCLGLRPLDPLGRPAGALERGAIVHRMVQEFVLHNPGPLPADAIGMLLQEAERAFADLGIDAAQAAFWRPRMRRIGRWFLELEETLRAEAAGHAVETDGECLLPVGEGGFRLTARADRIDRLHDGRLRILDYKTGALPSPKPSAKGFSPQLPLEGLIAREGGFPGLPPARVSELVYVRLSGGTPAGEHKPVKGEPEDLIDQCAQGLLELLAAYADAAVPYEARDWSDEPQGERDFGHLSRWREWSLAPEEDAV